MSNCENCIHDRVCGHKEKYKRYTKEFNELNKKWDLFNANPNCPEYTDKSLLKVNQKNYFNTSILEDNNTKVTYNEKAEEEKKFVDREIRTEQEAIKVKHDLERSIKRAEKEYYKNINQEIPVIIADKRAIELLQVLDIVKKRMSTSSSNN